jgi:probable rRNA maturation factor
MDDPGSTRDEPLEPPSPTTTVAQGGEPVAVDILDPDRRLPAPALRWLAEMARRAAATLGATGEVRVRIVGDDEMDRAHRRFKGVPGTTDVLTFDYSETPGVATTGEPAKLDTDILICADEASRQAAARGVDAQTELLLYIVHGMLHCLGHDDLTPDDAAAMHRREDEVLTALGVGPVYAREPHPSTTGGDPWA